MVRVFPHLDPTPTHTLTCLYSVTPDHDFVLDAHPTMPNVSKCACADPICNLVVSPTLHVSTDLRLTLSTTQSQVYVAAGFSGHGFKFGSALGEILACLALHAPFPPLLEQAMAKGRFALKRFAEPGSNKENSNVYR